MMWADHQSRPVDPGELVFDTTGQLKGGFQADVYDYFIGTIQPTGSGGNGSEHNRNGIPAAGSH
jgi:hypothetical protein